MINIRNVFETGTHLAVVTTIVVTAMVIAPFVSLVAVPIFALKALMGGIRHRSLYQRTLTNGSRARLGRVEGQDYTRWNGQAIQPKTAPLTEQERMHALMNKYTHGQSDFAFKHNPVRWRAADNSFKSLADYYWLDREFVRREKEDLWKVDLKMLRAFAKALIPILGVIWVLATELQLGGASELGCRVCRMGGSKAKNKHWGWKSAIKFHQAVIIAKLNNPLLNAFNGEQVSDNFTPQPPLVQNPYIKVWNDLHPQLLSHPICRTFLPEINDLNDLQIEHFADLYTRIKKEIERLPELENERGNIPFFQDPAVTIEPFLTLCEILNKSLDYNLERVWININYHQTGLSLPPLQTAKDIRAWLSDPANAKIFNEIKIIRFPMSVLTWFPLEICQLPVEEVDFSNNFMTILPKEIGNLKNLKKLKVSNNELTSLPPEIGELINLTECDLSQNQLTEIPPEIVHWKNLRRLDISDNQLTEIPSEIGHLQFLKVLKACNNENLEKLPLEICTLLNLKVAKFDRRSFTPVIDDFLKSR